MYKVIKYFTDLHDNDHPYHVGDEFPRRGIKVTDERLKELSGSENKQGVPLIEAVEEEEAEEKKTSAPAKKTTAKKAASTKGGTKSAAKVAEMSEK